MQCINPHFLSILDISSIVATEQMALQSIQHKASIYMHILYMNIWLNEVDGPVIELWSNAKLVHGSRNCLFAWIPLSVRSLSYVFLFVCPVIRHVLCKMEEFIYFIRKIGSNYLNSLWVLQLYRIATGQINLWL